MSERPKFLRDAAPIGKEGRRAAVYLCHCGKEFAWPRIRVESGHKVDCGCGTRERRAAWQRGLKSAHAAEYRVWQAMKFRCLNPSSKDWPRYGGAGVTICDEWVDSFESFLSHVGPRPSLLHSIDRIDNRDGYRPGNVAWATASDQARNKFTSYTYTIRGESFKTMQEAADRFGVAMNTVHKWVAGYTDRRRGARGVKAPRPDAQRSRVYE